MTVLRPDSPPDSPKSRAYEIIFGHETAAGRAFDTVLILAILASVAVIMLDSVQSLSQYRRAFAIAEWAFTVLFTVEYALRVWCVRNARGYVLSFFGIIDLLAVMPTYLRVLLPGGQFLAVIRILRVIRVFRVFKLVRFIGEASVLSTALRNARYKIAVFLITVVCLVVVVGSVMYIVEGPAHGFTSIPKGVYWAIVTLTTVGFGDVVPTTPLGQGIASFVMIIGYGIIAVPTGIVTAELAQLPRTPSSGTLTCRQCGHLEVDTDARYCRFCGAHLHDHSPYTRQHD